MHKLSSQNFTFDYRNVKGIHLGYMLLSTIFYFNVIGKGWEPLGYLIFYILPFLYMVKNYKIALQLVDVCLHSKLFYYIGILGILFFASLLLPIFHGTNDFTYFWIRIIQVGKESLKVLFLIVVFIKHISPEADYRLFIKYYVLSCCLYVVGTCIIISVPGLRDMILEFTKADRNAIRVAHLPAYITRFGWCGFSGFTYTLRCSLAGAFMIFLMYMEKEKNFYMNTMMLLVTTLGNFFYGRIGIVVTGIYFLILLYILAKSQRVLFYRFLMMMGGACAVLVVALIFVEPLRVWIAWVFQSFINYFTVGSLGTTSTGSLKKMYFLPDWDVLLFGSGGYTNADGTYYMGSDVGVLRPIIFGGVFFQILRYSTLGILLVYMKDLLKKPLCWAAYSLLILFVIFEIKGEAIFPVISILFGVALVLGVAKRNETKK